MKSKVNYTDSVKTNKNWLELYNLDLIVNNSKVFKNLSLTLKRKESTLLLGPNGSGKSSLIGLINRNLYPIVKPNSYIKLFGEENINIWELREKIGFVMTEVDERIQVNTKSWQIILSGITGAFRTDDKFLKKDFDETINNICDSLSIHPIINKNYASLSDGEKRKLIIARSLVRRPEILVLDEPYRNLDIRAKHELMKTIGVLIERGTTVLHVTHRVDTVIDSMERALFLKDGKIIEDGKINTLFTSQKLSELYETPLTLKRQQNCWNLYPRNGSGLISKQESQ